MSKAEEISTTRWIQNLRTALEAIDGIEMDEVVRKTIWRCLRVEWAEAVDRYEDLEMTANDGRRWTEEDDDAIRTYLTDKPVPPNWRDGNNKYWEQRRMLGVGLAYRLKRSEKNVSKRATALGFGHFQ